MELIKDYSNCTNTYTKKIRVTKYTEGENVKIEKKGVKDICEFIIANNDNEYATMQKNHRQNYIENKKLSIADGVQKDDKYVRTFNPKLIQSGLQSKNTLSSILYMNELFKVNTIIYNDSSGKFYKTSFMKYPVLVCQYKNDEWHEIKDKEIKEDCVFHPIEELSHILNIDTGLMIFKSKLEPLSNYKVKDLEDLCKEFNITTMKNGKKKLKKDLYEDLSLHYIQNI